MKIDNKILFKYVSALTVCVFVILVAVQAHKSFVLDEIDFPIVSHVTSQTLKPVYYRGEVSSVFKPVYFENGVATSLHIGLYHPTLYINTLATFIRTFGFNETVIRLFGVICTLITAYLLILILRQLTKKSLSSEVLLLAIFLLNPYTIANTTLPDIDSTVLPVTLLVFIYYSLRYLLQKKVMNRSAVLILGGIFALALWAKLTTPLALLPLLLGIAVITSKDIKRSILFTAKVGLFGLVVFMLTYFVYCISLGLSTTYTYGFLLDSFTKGTSSDGPLAGAINNLGNLRHFLHWPTLPIVGLFGISFISIIMDKNRSDETRIKKLLAATALFVTIFYIALIAPFGGFFKYPFPVFGILLLTIIFFYDRHLKEANLSKWYVVAAVTVGAVTEKIAWGDSMFTSPRPFGYLLLLAAIMAAGYFLTRLRHRHIIANFFMILILFAVGFQISVSRIQATAQYSTKYLYGQTGLDETTAYLRSNTTPDEAIWAMKDVGYYTYNKYHESYFYYTDPSLEDDLVNMLREGKVRYYVATTEIGQDNIDYYVHIKQILDSFAIREKQFGNYVIYKAKE